MGVDDQIVRVAILGVVDLYSPQAAYDRVIHAAKDHYEGTLDFSAYTTALDGERQLWIIDVKNSVTGLSRREYQEAFRDYKEISIKEESALADFFEMNGFRVRRQRLAPMNTYASESTGMWSNNMGQMSKKKRNHRKK